MSESIEQRVATAIFACLPGNEPVSRTALSSADIPQGIQHFLLQTLDRRVFLEVNRLTERMPQWLDATHPAASSLGESFADLLYPAGQFPVEEWKKAVPQAVQAVSAYLQQPTAALVSFAFPAEAPTVPAVDLVRRSGYFKGYPYMATAVEAWLQQRASRHVDRTAFESAMHELDCRLTTDYGTEAWMTLLQPLTAMVRFAGVQPDGLPVPMALRFFEGKRRTGIAASIRAAAKAHNAGMITLASLRDLIENGPAQGTGNDSLSPVNTAPPQHEQPQGPGSSGEPRRASDGPPMPLWKRFQQRLEGDASDQSADTAASPSAYHPQPLWKSFGHQGGTERRTDDGAQPIVDDTGPTGGSGNTGNRTNASLLPQDLPAVVLGAAVQYRDRFVRDLFDGNEDAFHETMIYLSAAPDWTVASAIIADRIFRPYRIDIYSDVAVDFTNAVEARYTGHQS